MISIYLYLYTNNSLDNAIIYIRVWLASHLRAEPSLSPQLVKWASRAELKLGQPPSRTEPSRAELGSFPALATQLDPDPTRLFSPHAPPLQTQTLYPRTYQD
jgi:hypothetical protein